MKVSLKIYPIAGVSDVTQELEITLSEGKLCELIEFVKKQFGIDPCEENIMIINNGQALDSYTDVPLCDGDSLWLMPCLSGG